MKTLTAMLLLTVTLAAQAQLANDAERPRIASARTELEAGFARENTDCYKNFWVNDCLYEAKRKRHAAIADLGRQEMTLNKQDRNVKASEQLKKTEEKTSLENQRQAADKRSKARSDFNARLARDQEKNAAQSAAKANEKSGVNAAEIRVKGMQDKQARRIAKQTKSDEEVSKYNQRIVKAQERQVKVANDKASQTKPLAQPLPISN